MADDPEKPADGTPDATGRPRRRRTNPPSDAPAEPLKAEVSRTDAPGAGASAAPPPRRRRRRPSRRIRRLRRRRRQRASCTGRRQPRRRSGRRRAKPAAPAAAEPAARPRRRETGRRARAEGGGADAVRPIRRRRPTRPRPAFIASLQAAIPGAVTQVSYWVGDWTIIVPAAQILEVARHLRDAPDAAFDLCSDVTATDWPPRGRAVRRRLLPATRRGIATASA